MSHVIPHENRAEKLPGDPRNSRNAYTGPASGTQINTLPQGPATPRALLSGAFAGAASVVVFAAVHHWLISDIWYSLGPMVIAGMVCGLCVAWSYRRLFRKSSAAGWLMYNLAYIALLVGLAVASVIVHEPVGTIPELLAMSGSRTLLIREAAALTVVFTLFSAVLFGLLWGRNLLDRVVILLTCTVIVVLLGLNVSTLGLVQFTAGTLGVLTLMFGLILVIDLCYTAFFMLLERKAFFVEARDQGPSLQPHSRSPAPWDDPC